MKKLFTDRHDVLKAVRSASPDLNLTFQVWRNDVIRQAEINIFTKLATMFQMATKPMKFSAVTLPKNGHKVQIPKNGQPATPTPVQTPVQRTTDILQTFYKSYHNNIPYSGSQRNQYLKEMEAIEQRGCPVCSKEFGHMGRHLGQTSPVRKDVAWVLSTIVKHRQQERHNKQKRAKA